MSLENKTVLIADDEPTVRAVVRLALKALNVSNILEAHNGREAVDLFQREKPDLVLLDINMPKLSGDAALGEIMRLSPDARVIMLTSVAKLSVAQNCVAMGAKNYILKSNPSETIRDMVRDALSEGDAE